MIQGTPMQAAPMQGARGFLEQRLSWGQVRLQLRPQSPGGEGTKSQPEKLEPCGLQKGPHAGDRVWTRHSRVQTSSPVPRLEGEGLPCLPVSREFKGHVASDQPSVAPAAFKVRFLDASRI